MDNLHDIEQRLTNLEIKTCFTDDLVDQLNQTVFRQQQQIDVMRQELSRLCQHLPEGNASAPRNLRDELPPHY